MSATTTTIIVGGGMAGLYAAWKLSKQNKEQQHIVILEKDAVLGGRAGSQPFAGTTILTGAGVGRFAKDKRLIALLSDLDLSYTTFEAKTQYSPALMTDGKDPATLVKQCFAQLRRAFRSAGAAAEKTFREFATSVLGRKVYVQFVAASGYSDYEDADVEDVLYRYGFDDNFTTWTAMGIAWKDVVQTLAKRLRQTGRVHILTSTAVTRIQRHDDDDDEEVTVFCKNHILRCRRLILATTVNTVQKLLPEFSSLYKHIHGQPFLRIYGQFAKSCRDRMREAVSITTIVPGPLHKLIPIDVHKGIYMIAYTDNADARRTAASAAPSTLCRLLERALAFPDGSLQLDKTVVIPWTIGTHYYDKLPEGFASRRAFVQAAQRPCARVLVVGEMVSLHHQGWVEGCLESVDHVL
jgi:hypothetical protein